MNMKVEAFFDDGRTCTLTYVVYDDDSRDAVIIDPVLDLDTTPWNISTESVEKVMQFVADRKLNVHWILDTHVHADHLSGANELKSRLKARTAIGSNISVVQEIFKATFNLSGAFPTDGSQFDRLLKDDDVLEAGSFIIDVMHTPGHTPACMSYRIGDTLFVGDVLFAPDIGVARCDFPGGSAAELYRSITERLYSFADDVTVHVGHDYPNGRPLRHRISIGESRQKNVDLPAGLPETEFVQRINERDARLSSPRLLFPSLQVNINAGSLPEADDNNIHYLRIPLNAL